MRTAKVAASMRHAALDAGATPRLRHAYTYAYVHKYAHEARHLARRGTDAEGAKVGATVTSGESAAFESSLRLEGDDR